MKRYLALCTTLLGACLAMNALASTPVTDELRRTAIVKAVEKAGPAVVNVSTERIIIVRRDPFWELFGELRHH
jgi:S1-C subfamily serine protease